MSMDLEEQYDKIYRYCYFKLQRRDLADAGCEEQLVLGLALRAALQELPEEERELVLLRYVNEVPVKVIGEVLGLSRFAVYRRTSAVLQKLQQKLGKEEEL